MQPFIFFISYRREDTGPIALLLKYEIEERLKFVRVLLDVSEMKIAAPFPEQIHQFIKTADLTIALIGKNWMPADRKIDENDWVVRELKDSPDSANLPERKILPIFVDRKKGFNDSELPDSINCLSELEGMQIQYANWPRQIERLIHDIADRYTLKKREKEDRPEPDPAKARTQAVSDEELAKTLAYDAYNGWYVDNFGAADERYLAKEFEFDESFNKAAEFMSIVSKYCNELGHHPDWRNVYDNVTVALTTWDAGNKITIYDLNLALYMNKVARALKANRTI